MFQSKRKLRETVAELTRRVEDLEERLCTMNEHDWKRYDETGELEWWLPKSPYMQGLL